MSLNKKMIQHKAVLLFGGNSEERFVSVASAQNLSEQYSFAKLFFQATDERVFEVTTTELQSHRDAFVAEFKPSSQAIALNLTQLIPILKEYVVFLGYHGSNGENGEVQKLFEEHRIAFTGSGSESSHNAFDKNRAKNKMKLAAVKLADSFELNLQNLTHQRAELETFLQTYRKIVLKPTASGSSFGLQIVSSAQELEKALQAMQTLPFLDYLVESFIAGRELTVATVQWNGQLRALPASEVVLNAGHSFDYNGKYLGTGTTELTPAPLTDVQMKRAQALAINSHQALGCFGYSRTDMILSDDEVYFLETNTLPGLSKPSFVPQQLRAAGLLVSDFIDQQIELAQKRYD